MESQEAKIARLERIVDNQSNTICRITNRIIDLCNALGLESYANLLDLDNIEKHVLSLIKGE